MEIIFDNVTYKNKFINVNLAITNNKINGIYNSNSFLKLIQNPKLIESGKILIGGNNYKKYDFCSISIIDREIPFYTSKVIDEIMFHAKIRGYKSHNLKKEIIAILDKLNINSNILTRICHSLSDTEKYYVKLVANLIFKPKIVIFKNIINGMDLANKKMMKKFIEDLKNDGILVIVTSNDSNILYELTEEIFIFNKGKILTSGNTNDVYTNIEILLKNNIDVPCFSLLTYKANNEKGAHLFYRKDVRDVIKDVYKSIS